MASSASDTAVSTTAQSASNALAALVKSDPAAVLLLFEDKLVTPAPSRSFRIHSLVLLALYGVMLVTFMVGSFIRYRKKQWWLFAKDSRGDVRVNIFLVFQLVLSIYSGTWIAVIAFSTSSTVRPTATLVLQLVVFLPLAFSGFGEVFALVTALPSTRLMVSFAGAPTRLSRFQTALESRGLLDLLSIGCPVGMLASVIPLSVMAGISQFRLQRDWAVVATALEGAVRTGWTPEALQETLVGLQTLSKQTTPFYWIRFVAAAYVFWTVVHQILYLPATFFVYKLLTEQKRYLHNSMMNAAALQSITSADLSGYRSPTFTGTDFGVRSPSGLSTGKEHSDVDRSGSKTSMASTCVEVGVPAPLSLAAKLKAVKINRQLTVLQLVVSEFIALGLLGFSIFNACDGLAKVSLALGREIYILVPTYTFLIPTLFASIAFGELSRRPAPDHSPRPARLPTSNDWIPYKFEPKTSSRSEPGMSMYRVNSEEEEEKSALPVDVDWGRQQSGRESPAEIIL